MTDEEHPDGVFVDINEDLADDIRAIRVTLIGETNHQFRAGEIPVEPGRYELRKVEEADEEEGHD